MLQCIYCVSQIDQFLNTYFKIGYRWKCVVPVKNLSYLIFFYRLRMCRHLLKIGCIVFNIYFEMRYWSILCSICQKIVVSDTFLHLTHVTTLIKSWTYSFLIYILRCVIGRYCVLSVKRLSYLIFFYILSMCTY